MQTVIETEIFARRADKLFSAQERKDLIAFNPHAGDEIPGTGGVRKLRMPAKDKGKRGGSRVIYFMFDGSVPIYLLLCYGKNERADMTEAQKKAAKAFATAIKQAARQRRTK